MPSQQLLLKRDTDSPCDGEIIEMMDHVISYCLPHQELLSSFFTKHPGHSDSFYLKLLLSNQSDLTWLTVAKYCSIVFTICCSMFSFKKNILKGYIFLFLS